MSDNTHAAEDILALKPLTSQEIRKKLDVKGAYAEFWNNIKFRKGWATPHINYEDVEDLLDIAAEIVVRVRAHLDAKHPGIKLRVLDGSAQDWLWTVEKNPKDHPDEFIRGIVHASFKDANGYVEGLTEDMVSKYMDQVLSFIKQSEKDLLEQGTQLKHEINDYYTQTGKILDEVLAQEPTEKTKEHIKHLQQVLNSIKNVKSTLESLRKLNNADNEQQPNTTDSTAPTATTPSEQSTAQPVVTEPDDETPAAETTSMETTSTDEAPQPQPEQQTQAEADPKPEQPQATETQIPVDTSAANTAETTPEARPLADSGVLQVKKVSDDVNLIKSKIQHVLENASGLHLEELAKNPDESIKLVEKLNKDCLMYSENLMKDLLSLDAITASEQSRPLRKEQVKTIQELLSDVDRLRDKLGQFKKHIEQERKEQKKVEEAQHKEEEEANAKRVQELAAQRKQKREARKQRKREARAHHAQTQPQSEMSDEEDEEEEQEQQQPSPQPPRQLQVPSMQARWKSLKLKPKFEINQTRDAYVVTSYIPGMDEKDIQLGLGPEDTLNISGSRVPTPQEEQVLRRQIREYMLSRGLTHIKPQEEDMALLQMGAGRYGSFSEAFTLTNNVDVNNITAQYTGGVLRVVIPKLKPKVQHPQYPRQPAYPFFGGGGGGHHGGFFDDRDMWW